MKVSYLSKSFVEKVFETGRAFYQEVYERVYLRKHQYNLYICPCFIRGSTASMIKDQCLWLYRQARKYNVHTLTPRQERDLKYREHEC